MNINFDDNILVKNVQENNDENSLRILIDRHSGLCNSLYKKYSSSMVISGVHLQDVMDQKDYIVYKSAMTFNPCKKSKFSTSQITF